MNWRELPKERELIEKLKAEHHLDTDTETIHRIFEILLGEHPLPSWLRLPTGKVAAAEPSSNGHDRVEDVARSSHSPSSAQSAPPQKLTAADKELARWQLHYEREVKLAYAKEEAKQRAKTEGETERAEVRRQERALRPRMSNEEWIEFAERVNKGGAKNYYGNA